MISKIVLSGEQTNIVLIRNDTKHEIRVIFQGLNGEDPRESIPIRLSDDLDNEVRQRIAPLIYGSEHSCWNLFPSSQQQISELVNVIRHLF